MSSLAALKISLVAKKEGTFNVLDLKGLTTPILSEQASEASSMQRDPSIGGRDDSPTAPTDLQALPSAAS